MERTKKLISLLLCLLLLAQLAPAVVAAEVASGMTGDVSWSLNDSGILSLSGSGSTGDYSTASETPWYAYADQITGLEIGGAVRRIGSYAFAGLPNLKEVTVPENVLYIGFGAFCNSGLERICVYSRGVAFEQIDYDDSVTLPVACVVYGYENSDAEYYCYRNYRTWVELTEGKMFSQDSGNSTYPLTYGEEEYQVAGLWNASTAEIGSPDSVLLDYTLTVDAAQLQRVHNAMKENEADRIGDDYYNDGQFEIEIHFSLREHDKDSWSFGGGAYYGYAETDLRGNTANNYHRWHTYTNGENGFLKLTANGTKLTIQVDATVKELYEAAQAIEGNSGEDGKGTQDNRVDQVYFQVIARGETYYIGYGGGVYQNESTYIDSVHQSLYDAHLRESEAPSYWMTSFDTVYPIADYPPFANENFYEPVKREYVWTYQFSRMGDYDEALGRNWGDILWDAESDGLYLEEHDGILYGGLIGTYDAGESNDFTIRKIMDVENTPFLESLMGLQPDGFGGPVHIMLECSVTLTYADGQVVQLWNSAADEGTMLVGLCPHTCSVCGLCTAEENLACNTSARGGDFSGEGRENQCRCEDPKKEAICTLVPADQVGVFNETWMDSIKVRVEEVEPVGMSPYVQKLTRELLDVSIINLFEISVYDEYGNPYRPNAWGGEEEKLTLTVPVDKEWADLAFEAGDAELYHMDPETGRQKVPVTYNSAEGTITFTGTGFSPYALVQTAGFYGRKALEQLPNAEGLLYAYDQLAKGVETAQESISVYDGVHPVSKDEFDTVMSAYLRDYVAHFWCGNTYTLKGTMDCIKVVMPTYTIKGAELEAAMAAFEAVTQEILAGINPGMDDYERELYVHDQITYRIRYQAGTNAHNAYGALVEGKAVCDGYSEAFGYLLQRLGIQTFQALGSGINPNTGSGEKHSWTYVRIKGRYYHVDTTWDSQKEEVFHMYFNQSDAVMFEDHVTDPTAIPLPVCQSDKAFYFEGKAEKMETYTVDGVAELINSNGNKTHIYIPGDPAAFSDWLFQNAQDLFGKVEASGALRCVQLGREFMLQIRADGHKLTGTVTGFAEAGDTVNLALYLNGAFVATKTVHGGSPDFLFENVQPGEYVLKLSGDGYFQEEYQISVGAADTAKEISLLRKGDLNGDGKLNNKDVTRLMQYLADWDVAVVEKTLDVNNDGKKNNKDVTRLMQFLAGWDVKIYES